MPIWLACMPLSLCILTILLPSSSVTLGGLDPSSEGCPSPFLASFAAFCCCSSKVILSVCNSPIILSVAVGSKASTVKVQSSWFCSNRRRRLRCSLVWKSEVQIRDKGKGTNPYFSRAIRSLLMRSRASEIFPNTYWVATYPTPITPKPIAKGVLFRRSHFLVAEIMACSSVGGGWC